MALKVRSGALDDTRIMTELQFLKKGTVVKRVSLTKDDPTYDNKKYVSINQDDHSKWESYLGKAYIERNHATFTQTYVTTKDLKVMSSTKQGELYAKMLLNSKFKEQAMKDTAFADAGLNQKRTNDLSENISRNIAMQTATGKAFVKEVLAQNYDAIVDTHGTNVAKSPLIVLNPDSNLARYAEPVYTKAVEEWLKSYYARAA